MIERSFDPDQCDTSGVPCIDNHGRRTFAANTVSVGTCHDDRVCGSMHWVTFDLFCRDLQPKVDGLHLHLTPLGARQMAETLNKLAADAERDNQAVAAKALAHALRPKGGGTKADSDGDDGA